MNTTEVAKHIGIPRKELTRFLRRVERGLGIHVPNLRREFDTDQAEQLRLAYHQGHNHHPAGSANQ